MCGIFLALMPFALALSLPPQASATPATAYPWGKITAGNNASVNAATDFAAPTAAGTDATDALQNALNYLANTYPQTGKENTGVALYIPTGTYKISKRLHFKPQVMGKPQSIVIRGAGNSGSGATIIKLIPGQGETDLGGIVFDFSNGASVTSNANAEKHVQIEDIQFQTTAANSGSAIEVQRFDATPAPSVMTNATTAKSALDLITNSPLNVTPVLRSVTIAGDATAFFNYGLKGLRLLNPRMNSVTINGDPGHPSRTQACLYAVNGYSSLALDCVFSGAVYGVFAPYTSEGNTVNRSLITNVDYAFRVNVSPVSQYRMGPSGAGGGLSYCVIAAHKTGIWMELKQHININGNEFRAGAYAALDYTHILLSDCKSVIVTENVFNQNCTAGQKGVWLSDSTDLPGNFPEHTTIANNFFYPAAGQPAVYVGENCSYTSILNNGDGPTHAYVDYRSNGTTLRTEGTTTIATYPAGSTTKIRKGAPLPPIDCLASKPSYLRAEDTPSNLLGNMPISFNWKAQADSIGSNNTVDVKADALASGDGVTDDTVAIQSAVTALKIKINNNQSHVGALYFPAGKYKITGNITISDSNSSAWQNILIYGDGVQGSRILATPSSPSTTDVFSINTGNGTAVTMHNLAVVGKVTGIRSAIKVTQPAFSSSPVYDGRSLLMYDVDISGDSGSFLKGVIGTNLANPLMVRVVCHDISTTGITMSGGYGFECEGTSVLCGATTGFDITSLGNPNVPGITGDVLIRGMVHTGPLNGMTINAGGAKVETEGVHANSTTNNLSIANASRVVIEKLYTLNSDEAGSVAGRASLRLANCADIHVTDSLFVQAYNTSNATTPGNPLRTSIVLGNSATSASINGNMFAESGTGINMGTGYTASSINDNRFWGPVVTPIVNASERQTTYSPSKAQQTTTE